MHKSTQGLTKQDFKHLERCITIAEEALDAGDEPFGSILVNAKEEIVAEARNRVNEQTVLAHPEIELARWALEHLAPEERKRTTMYTTGEHCPMCAAAHGWAGLGNIIYISSAGQLTTWLREMNITKTPINFIPVQQIVPDLKVTGPVNELADSIKALHIKYHNRSVT